ncbi:hypothetical protein FIV42_27270 [Persicimonas caeni]|uniref:BIG2 domain-containing protein n=1 Tax=Persicimonas caeni TaxID=2292766 RepID=A0A4Y6Q1C9_PERCE|nr:hypothetical protein [Persicimonas caeni]QDG54312.1 hypothetical protein FIV42_27270 [Persicimonas caeni]QED35533.1 hypothetical protein FRD00_27265 [Persicimonas caeni]
MRSKFVGSLWLLSCLFLLLSACGRDGVAERCQSDNDCTGERMCVSGQCLDPGDIDAGPDADAAIVCTSNDDCPQAGACYESGGGCVSSSCVIPEGAEQGECELEPCVLESCAPYEDGQGCGCVPRACESASDCGEFACVGGECAPCTSDAECGDGTVCAEDGRCVEGTSCETDADCPARQMCDASGLCVDRPECLLDDDCADQEICLNGQCTYSPDCESDADCDEGFECVGDQCYEALCRGPEDCPADQFCDAGECVEPPSASSCFVAAQNGVISANQRYSLEAFAVDAEGNGIPASFVWASSNESVATIDATGPSAVGQGATGTTTITAALADTGVQCSGEIVLTGQSDVSPGDLRVVVTDVETGRGVSGAEVVLSNGTSAGTDQNGVALLAAPQGQYDVSVFSDAHNFVTVLDVQSTDIRVPLTQRRGTGPVAGFTGQFDLSQINTTGDVTLGLAGASIAGGLLDLDLQRLLGEPFMTRLEVPGMGGQDVPLPGGLVVFGRVFGFDLDFKRTYYANTSGGARIGWGLAGKVPAQRLFSLFQNGGGGTGDVLTTLLPLFNRFDHATKPLNLVEQPRVQDTGDLDGDGDTTEMVPDYDAFPQESLAPHVRQNLVTDVDVSNFPQMSDGAAELAVLVGGALLDAPGYVPLGISATNDQDGDGRPDTRRLTMAPPHGSISGGRFAIVALAFRSGQVGFQNGVQLPDEFSASLWNGQSLPTAVGLGTFPDASQGTIDDNARTISVTADAGPVYRVRLVGEERTWDVWSKGAPGVQGTFSHQVVIPTPPSGRSDLFTSAEVFVDAIAAQVTMDDLVRATGIGLRDAGVVATSFSRTKIR